MRKPLPNEAVRSCEVCQAPYRPFTSTQRCCGNMKCSAKSWTNRNRDKSRELDRAWTDKNRTRRHQLHQKSYQKHREKRIAQSHAWYLANKERRLESNRLWRAKNVAKVKLYRHNREDMERKMAVSDGTITPEGIENQWKIQAGRCGICGKKMKDYTLDHIVPLSKGGPHGMYNIQLAHHSCNSRKRATMSEHDIQKAVMQWLTLKRIFFFRNNTGAFRIGKRFVRFGSPGSPDIICIFNGCCVGLEIKSAKTYQSRKQISFQHEFESAGGRYFVCRSLDDAIEAFRT